MSAKIIMTLRDPWGNDVVTLICKPTLEDHGHGHEQASRWRSGEQVIPVYIYPNHGLSHTLLITVVGEHNGSE